MSASISLFGGTGFILGRYAQLYPEDTVIEPRDALVPTQKDVLWGISTTTNYAPLDGDLEVDIATNLTHLARRLPHIRGQLCFLSSWFVSGQNDWGHHPTWRAKETHLCNPNGWYSATKLAAEHLIRSYVETVAAVPDKVAGPSAYRILRLSNVIGNDPRAGRQKAALEWLLGLVISHQDVPLYESDGGGVRDILHVDDTCRAIRLCIEKGDLNTIYNIGRGESHRMEDLIQYAIQQTGSRSKVVRVPVPPFHRVVQVPRFYMDTAKLRALGFEPTYSIQQSVDRVLAGLTAGPVS